MSTFFATFILCKGKLFNALVLSQCIVYWINFQNIYTFTYQKSLLHTLFCFFLKSSKAFSVSLKFYYRYHYYYLKHLEFKENFLFSLLFFPQLLASLTIFLKKPWSINTANIKLGILLLNSICVLFLNWFM